MRPQVTGGSAVVTPGEGGVLGGKRAPEKAGGIERGSVFQVGGGG